ncbi:MAG: hypothetical protein ACT4P3_13315 [Betaproteobacteria bacterium]
MIDWSVLPMAQLLETYTVSNTASYLYSRFRRDSTVKELVDSNDIPSLTSELKSLLGAEKLTAETAVQAYACLVALTYKDLAAVKNSLQSLDMTKLRWAQQILALAEAKYVPTSSVFVPYQPPVGAQSVITNVGSSTNVNRH